MHDIDFVCSVDEIGVLEKGSQGQTAEGPYIPMFGWASTPDLDADNERVIQKGLVLNDYVSHGWINWNHQADEIIGIPRVGEIRDRGNSLGKGFYTEFDLIKALPMAQKVYNLSKALQGTDRALGMSVEGKKLAVDSKGAILKAKVVNVAVCPNPRNPATSIHELTKAIITQESDTSRFDYKPYNESELVNRVESVISSTITKAMGPGVSYGGANQEDGAGVRLEHLIPVSDNIKDKVANLPEDLKPLGMRLLNVSEERGWKLTKAESALCAFLVGSNGSLIDYFKVFGL